MVIVNGVLHLTLPCLHNPRTFIRSQSPPLHVQFPSVAPYLAWGCLLAPSFPSLKATLILDGFV